MTLENLCRIGKLKQHRAQRVDVHRLIASAESRLADARVKEISADTRFGLAYDCILKAAAAAMWANGYRASTSEPGHHQLLVQSLAKTAGLSTELVVVLDAYRKLRNKSDYEGVPVADSVAIASLRHATFVLEVVRRWIKANKPDLA